MPKLTRIHIHMPPSLVKRVDEEVERALEETGVRKHRSDIIRMLILKGLAEVQKEGVSDV